MNDLPINILIDKINMCGNFVRTYRLLEEAVNKVNKRPIENPDLPIADQSALRSALQAADTATLLMVFTQYTHDEAFLERWNPYLGSPWNPHAAQTPVALAIK